MTHEARTFMGPLDLRVVGDSWEARMSARARGRIRAEQLREQAEQDARYAAEHAAEAAQDRVDYDAGPPGSCRTCFTWAPDFFTVRHSWWHVPMCQCSGCGRQRPANIVSWNPETILCAVCGQPATLVNECTHECHGGESYGCAPVVIG